MANKEEVYDSQINPLMAQIIKICQEHKIAMLASFAIPTPGDPGLRCTTSLLSEEHLAGLTRAAKDDYLAALSIIKDGFIAYIRRKVGNIAVSE
jgi:hypothetical protein